MNALVYPEHGLADQNCEFKKFLTLTITDLSALWLRIVSLSFPIIWHLATRNSSALWTQKYVVERSSMHLITYGMAASALYSRSTLSRLDKPTQCRVVRYQTDVKDKITFLYTSTLMRKSLVARLNSCFLIKKICLYVTMDTICHMEIPGSVLHRQCGMIRTKLRFTPTVWHDNHKEK